MQSIFISIIIVIVSFTVIIFSTKYTNERCIEKGGQIVLNAGVYHNACILPKGVK